MIAQKTESPSERRAGLVSVVMPAHNSERTLAESVRSVLAQTYPDWELVFVDDASTDGTLTLARELAREEPRIRVLSLEQNVGVAEARNRGIEAGTGQYLAFLDSDDLWLPDKLEVQVEFMRSTGAAFSFAQYRRIGVDGALGNPVPIPATVNYEQLLRGNSIGCLTVLIDRNQVLDISMPKIRHEDYVTWLRILKQGHIAHGIQKDLARYRVTSASVSSDKRRSAGWTWNIYRRVEGLSVLKSAWCFLHYTIRAIYIRRFS
ncbi:MAG TPA: glycosyltransferase family 2 protein [Acidobacteriaceae bacterium]